MRASWRALAEKKRLTLFLYFCNSRTMKKPDPLLVMRYAERFAAPGAEPRLAIPRLLLSAHPTGMIAGEVQGGAGNSSVHAFPSPGKIATVGLVNVRRVGTFLWYFGQ